MNLAYNKKILEKAGVRFEKGLSEKEINNAGCAYGLVFPEDLCEYLSYALPKGERFPNWRNLEDKNIQEALQWPLEGIQFDIEHNNFWMPEWGEKPEDIHDSFEIAQIHVDAAPKLIPICGHRYLPERPKDSGNPVFSVHQTDIIYYGGDIENYLHNEYYWYFGVEQYQLPEEMREIEFWSKLTS